MKSTCLLLLLPILLKAQILQYNARLLQSCWQGHYSPSLDPFLILDHPSALCDGKSFMMGVKTERHSGSSNAGNVQAVMYYPFEVWKISTWYDARVGAGLGMHELGVNVARNLGKSDVGFQLNRQVLAVSGKGKDQLLSGKIEWWWHLANNLGAGITVHHPFGARFLRLDSEKPAFATGFCMAWKLSEKLSCSIEALKQEGLPFTANAGIQYWTENALLLRGGVSTSTAEISFLAAWKWSKVMIGSSCRFHPQIGTMAGLVFYYYPKTFLN